MVEEIVSAREAGAAAFANAATNSATAAEQSKACFAKPMSV